MLNIAGWLLVHSPRRRQRDTGQRREGTNVHEIGTARAEADMVRMISLEIVSRGARSCYYSILAWRGLGRIFIA